MAEASDGGFSGVYPVLRAMEEAGRSGAGTSSTGSGRRSSRWPVPSIDCGPFATMPRAGPGHRPPAADPANPYGAALAWPRRGEDDRRPLQRAAGAYVVLVDGVAAVPGARRLHAPDAAGVRRPGGRHRGRARLASLVRSGRFRGLVVRKADGEDIATAPARAALLEAGFVAGYRGLTLRAER